MNPAQHARATKRLVTAELRASALIEQYKVVRASITDIVQDRNSNNNMMLAIAAGILGVQGFLLKPAIEQANWPIPTPTLFLVAVFGGVGIILAWLWKQWSKSYETGLRSRYMALREIEAFLPAQPFARELEIRNATGYRPVTSIIESLSTMFLAVFLSTFIACVTLIAHEA